MPAFIISVHLPAAGSNDYGILSAAMKSENFSLVNIAGSDGREFAYYGNLNLLDVTGIVKRIAASTGKGFSFTVIKNKMAEKQSHKSLHTKV